MYRSIKCTKTLFKTSKALLIAFCVILLAGSAHSANFRAMEAKLQQLIAPYGSKIGLAFIDPRTGASFAINGDLSFPAASVIKMPVMAAVFYMADNGSIKLSEKIPVHKEDKLGGSGVLQWRAPGRQTILNLARLMISISDNTATRLLVNKAGKDNINEYCSMLGLLETHLYDETALVEPPLQCNRTSPRDMARLAFRIYDGKSFSRSSRKQMLSFMKNQRYRWGIVKPLPKGVVVANKTGNVTGVLNDVGIVYTKKGNYILAIFTWGFPQKSSARKLINRVSEMVYNFYTK